MLVLEAAMDAQELARMAKVFGEGAVVEKRGRSMRRRA